MSCAGGRPSLWPWFLLCLPWLLAPTQGAVGGCSCEDDPLAEPVDVRAYCNEREQLVCVREFERGRSSALERDACRREAIERCAGRSFPEGCQPTRREAQACLNALHSRSTLDRTIDALPECSQLCAPPSVGLDGGAADGAVDGGAAADGAMDAAQAGAAGDASLIGDLADGGMRDAMDGGAMDGGAMDGGAMDGGEP